MGSSELKPGMFSNPGKQKKDKPTAKGSGKKKRKSYYLDAETLDGLERIVSELRERDIRTDTGREMTEHFLVVNLLAQVVNEILEGKRKVVLPSSSPREVEIEL